MAVTTVAGDADHSKGWSVFCFLGVFLPLDLIECELRGVFVRTGRLLRAGLDAQLDGDQIRLPS